jgi:hypothetical protein
MQRSAGYNFPRNSKRPPERRTFLCLWAANLGRTMPKANAESQDETARAPSVKKQIARLQRKQTNRRHHPE